MLDEVMKISNFKALTNFINIFLFINSYFVFYFSLSSYNFLQ